MSEVVNMKVVGVGGAGNNVVSRMRSSGLDGVTYVNINTDRATLVASAADERVQIGEKLTHGSGAGSKPEVGRMAAEDSGRSRRRMASYSTLGTSMCMSIRSSRGPEIRRI